LIAYTPLRPLLQAIGWMPRARQGRGGTLRNSWYEDTFTRRVGIERAFYRDKKILDVGCGPRGSLEWADHAAERVGLDPLVDRYRSLGIDRHDTHYVNAPVEAIPYPDGYFDVVSSINSLDHVEDVDAAIREMIRVVAVGGLILLVVEIHPRPTIAEPHALPWELVRRFEPAMRVVEQRHLERPADGTNYLDADIPFDHDRRTERSGILVAKMVKEALSYNRN
jgi:ubiquinone/menaquinone biosynthesis C-methylase UbiE